jgi:CRP/FNR family transcriptional regulator
MSMLEGTATQFLENTATAAVHARSSTAEADQRLPACCSLCGLRQACLPCDLASPGNGRGEQLPVAHRRVVRGDSLYRAGDAFHSLYTVRSGFFKTVQSLDGGRDQVTGFHMAGDLLGSDGIGSGTHGSDVVALEDSRVCVIPYSRIEQSGRTPQIMVRQLHKALSGEIVREHSIMLLLGVMSADERLAVFLLNLSERFLERGYSPSEFNLRMTRQEIGSYLGLKLETVSRVFSKFRDLGLIDVNLRHICIRDVEGLRSHVNTAAK